MEGLKEKRAAEAQLYDSKVEYVLQLARYGHLVSRNCLRQSLPWYPVLGAADDNNLSDCIHAQPQRRWRICCAWMSITQVHLCLCSDLFQTLAGCEQDQEVGIDRCALLLQV